MMNFKGENVDDRRWKRVLNGEFYVDRNRRLDG